MTNRPTSNRHIIPIVNTTVDELKNYFENAKKYTLLN